MQLFWTPLDEAPPDSGRFAQRSRLVRFVGVSVAVHVLAVVAAPWLSSLMPPREEPVITRVVDFVVPDTPSPAQAPKPDAPLADRDDRAGSPPIRAPREGGRPKAAPAVRKEPAKAPAAVAKAESPAPAPAPRDTPKPQLPAAPPRVVAKAETPRPAPAPVPAATAPEPTPAPAAPPVSTASPAGDLPTPAAPAEDPRLAAATPKSLGNVTARTRGPAAIGAPSAVGGSSPSASPSGTAVASVPSVVTGTGRVGTAPVAPVALPPGLTGLGGSGGGAGGGVGLGAGGRGGSGGGDGTGQVDMRDPDFSEYFRLIEKRVRAAWKFPDSLGGTTQTVKIGFALGPEGSLREVRVVSSSSGTLNDSALTAMKKAAPFPPLPSKFRMLAGQPLVMSFTVTIQ